MISQGTILKLVLDYIYPGAGTALNILHYVFSGADAEDQDVLDAIEDWALTEWGDHWKELAGDTAEFNSIEVQEVDQTGEILRNVGNIVINLSGVAATGPLPAANSVYLLAYTGVPQVRGAKYVPAIAEEAVQDGSWTLNALAEIAFLLLAYLGRINVGVGQNLDGGVLSEREAGFKAFTGQGQFAGLPAYQRRRKDGVGS